MKKRPSRELLALNRSECNHDGSYAHSSHDRHMSNSLRDQLLQAGFAEKTPKPAKRSKPQDNRARQQTAARQAQQAKAARAAEAEAAEARAVAERKEIKASIKALIEADGISDFTGEVGHHYIAGSRVRTLYVSDPIRQRLIDGELAITRLNGSTWLVPLAVTEKVLQLNPDWAVFKTTSDAPPSDDTASADEASYADFPVPDDLTW